jgi:membrane protein YdbS with pleckstrin-like domain
MATRTLPPSPKYLRAAYLANGEEVRAETRATKLFFFPVPILALLIVGVLDYAAAASNYSWLPGIPGLTPLFGTVPRGAVYLLDFFLIMTVMVMIWLLARYFRWIRTVYAVTSSRVIIQSGIFARDFEEIPINQVRGIDVHQTAFHRLLGFGTLHVSSEQGSRIGNEDWVGIPHPFDFQRVIENASQAITRGNAPAMMPPPTAG